jgi:hypothetical protein
MATTTKLSVLAVQMPADLAERFRRVAEKNGRTVQQEIRCALREHVERERTRPSWGLS